MFSTIGVPAFKSLLAPLRRMSDTVPDVVGFLICAVSSADVHLAISIYCDY